MNKKWMPHGITAGVLVVFIVLGLACASEPSPTKRTRERAVEDAYNNGDVQFLATIGEYDKALELLRTDRYENLDDNGHYGYGMEGRFISSKGLTALMRAAWDGRLDVVQALVEKGANVNLRVIADNEYKGKTAAVLAYDSGYIKIVEYLKEHGAIDFDPVQGQAPGVSAPASSSQQTQKTYVVTITYELSGTSATMTMPYTVQAGSAQEAQILAEGQWRSTNFSNNKFLHSAVTGSY
jgi:hypothetical protein